MTATEGRIKPQSEDLARVVAEMRAALVMAQSCIHTHLGTPDPEDRFADQILIAIEAQMDAALTPKATQQESPHV